MKTPVLSIYWKGDTDETVLILSDSFQRLHGVTKIDLLRDSLYLIERAHKDALEEFAEDTLKSLAEQTNGTT